MRYWGRRFRWNPLKHRRIIRKAKIDTNFEKVCLQKEAPVSRILVLLLHIQQAEYHERQGSAFGPDEIGLVYLTVLLVSFQSESVSMCSFAFPSYQNSIHISGISRNIV